MLSKNWRNTRYYPPFMGVFYLSPLDRVVHGIVSFLLGAFITSYKNLYIFEQLVSHDPNPDKISNWFIIPFCFLTYALIHKLIELKPLVRLKEKEIAKGSFPWKYFILDSIYGISILLILQVVYLIFVILFAMTIWL